MDGPDRPPEGATSRAPSSQPPTQADATTQEPAVDCHLPAEPIELDWPAPLMTAAEVAAVLRVTPKSVREHIRRGNLRALRLNGTGSYRVRARDAQAWAQSQLARPDQSALAVDRYIERRAASTPETVTTNRRRRRRNGAGS
jgi:excisionase family DNA binding protein